MTEKKQPTIGALGNPYGTAVPDDVLNFFGADAPAEQPAVRWTEEQELAALESERQAAATREAEAIRQAELARLAEAEAAAKAEAKRNQAKVEPQSADLDDEPLGTAPARGSEAKSFGQTIRSHWDSLIDSLGISAKAKADRTRAREEADSRRTSPTSENAATSNVAPVTQPSNERMSTGERGTPAKVTKPVSNAPMPEEIPSDAFGFGIFANPKTTPPSNPLDSLFETPAATEEPKVTDSRRRRSRPTPAVAPIPEPELEASENEIEFEVVDLAGDDISDLWEGEARSNREARGHSKSSAPTPRSARPDIDGAERSRPRTRKPTRESVELDQPEDVDVRDEVRRKPREPRSEGRHDVRREPRSEVRREPRTEPLRDTRDDEPVEVSRETRGVARRPIRDEEDREERRPARRPAASRPAPVPSPPEDDDDGYTVDNSWVADDPRDADAPKRKPVPTWRRVVDHIVDRNLSNRRGGGGRGRGSSPPRSGAAPSGRPEVPAARVKRDHAPTYLDVPADDFEEAFDETLVDDVPSRGSSRRNEGDYRQSPRGRAPEATEPSDRNQADANPRAGRRPRPADEFRDPPTSREPRRRDTKGDTPRREPVGREPVGREPVGREPAGRERVSREPIDREPPQPRGRSQRPSDGDDFDSPPPSRGRRRY